jgi:hypothetical protein
VVSALCSSALRGPPDLHRPVRIRRSQTRRKAATRRTHRSSLVTAAHPTKACPEPLASNTTVILTNDLLDWVDNMAITWELPWLLVNDVPGPNP